MPRAACFVLQCKDDGAAIAEELTAADLDIFIVDEVDIAAIRRVDRDVRRQRAERKHTEEAALSPPRSRIAIWCASSALAQK